MYLCGKFHEKCIVYMETKELKLKDVMCGDWVDVRNDVSPNTPHIEKITPSHFLRDEHWYGIELTPEILEKNRFVEWRDKCYRWEYADGIYINVDFTEEEPWAHISNRCYSATPICRYVHELQHALRLCGIEKEIVI